MPFTVLKDDIFS